MKIGMVFLGTGQAVPTAKRNHTAILLKYQNENILFDCGEGTQTQFRKAGINPCKLTRIFISHWHADHILGLPGLFQTLALSGYSKTLDVYGPVGTKKYLSRILGMFIFAGKLNVNINEIKNDSTIKFNDFNIEAARLYHGCPVLGYRFVEKDKVRIDKNRLRKLGIKPCKEIGLLKKGKDIKINNRVIRAKEVTYLERGKKIAVIMDTRIAPNCFKIAKDADLLVCESTYLDELKDRAFEYKHLTNVQAASIAKKARAKKLALIHISQRHEADDKKILEEAKKVFRNTILTQDLMRTDV